ncbi:SigE family RNA polymerase sigma factor [Paractinoplanes durhamensis]|uniref:DNA-directed RNA polymerase sigma-70 factor n=1 Tax=Paractinoplanes durhamensis TaxID=113563 RepID=A0ABQ3Z692_9ACTN|nr:SigE family RNA polymerase sigma factor [Actinoplanes durhamensis]GIE05347.1 DNA-directed RNA polymerase sigma-70 factor [Actinoplanes durhamensis]
MDQSLETEFTAFVAERGQALLRIAHALTGDRGRAEDLVQGALAKAYAKWPRIHGDAEAYVRRVIYNDRVSVWRRASRRPEVLAAEVPERPGHDLDVAERIAVREALLSLPARQRAVLVLRYLEDLSVEETAEALGCRPGTVASQTSRALAKLRETVGSDEHTWSMGGTR